NIDRAYAKVTNNSIESVKNIIDKYRSDYKVSIDDFAEQVKKYIDNQDKNFRLNFFVDEVGQYIADNVKLMTNLQTVAESLATKCKGRAWLIVTAQEDMDSVVGEMKQQTNDFSKIQARFKNRMKLTSADVSEVIQKRLLEKKDNVTDLLKDIYIKENNNFQTRFSFADGAQDYKNFKDEENFINIYPFIPYQFSLFQQAIKNLSDKNAFEGRHSSVGERSMLGVFQEVVKTLMNQNIGELATFDLMFEGIRTSLKTNIQHPIQQAENNLSNPFAIKILKVLLLVKYIKSFRATCRNLKVLMIDSFEQDLEELNNKVQEGLNILEQQTYIQRNAEFYEYLTDEEKDIEQEIKNTDYDITDIYKDLEKQIFNNILRSSKIRYKYNNNDYPFSRKVDDKLFNQEYELSINIITPFYKQTSSEELKIKSMGNMSEILIKISDDDNFVKDLILSKQTEKYVNQSYSTANKESVKRILAEKQTQNNERNVQIKEKLMELLSKSDFYLKGKKIESNLTDPKEKITQEFEHLIELTYTNLKMLDDKNYTEDDISEILKKGSDSLYSTGQIKLTEAESEVFNFIQREIKKGLRINLKNIIDNFNKKPYGWKHAGILCVLASLSAKGKIECKSDSNVLEGNILENSLRKTAGYSNIIVIPQIEFTPGQIKILKNFYNDFFNKISVDEPKILVNELKSEIKTLINQINDWLNQKSTFNFLDILIPFKQKLESISDKDFNWYFTDFKNYIDELLDLKLDIYDPLANFMNGEQKSIYIETKKFLENQRDNIRYVENAEVSELTEILENKNCFKGNSINKLKTIKSEIENKIKEQINNEKNNGKEQITEKINDLKETDDFKKLSNEKQLDIIEKINCQIREMEMIFSIPSIKDIVRNFKDEIYPKLIREIHILANPVITKTVQTDDKKTDTKPAKKTEFIKYNDLKFDYKKNVLSTEEDIQDYLNEIKKSLDSEIKKGNKVIIQ
ncbi:MAG: BREX system P-loop protein BrxC, partial [Candidatus Muirbacterium halophilum]|nr:BREX system P-loop protein BrxC [Candidatus Muirbacterium halophilum]